MKRTLAMAAMLMLAACTTMTNTADMPMEGGWMPESDIAAIVATANEGEIQQGNTASTRATSADVRSFAQMMVTPTTPARSRKGGGSSARVASARARTTPRARCARARSAP